ncbi:hypothetical protein BLL52_3793 [Rhodoferax antarcticus ANT.BR]|uniref:Uncharacterized protein n=1 Tax=Rhodoferax antarcticus ANT.BR TaxID=1111071 RepID=A0A1Q8YAG8_9BURK|nr:hypothetical protein BLL52_3793 [Rhodoferax antarcticus ANT.BR]
MWRDAWAFFPGQRVKASGPALDLPQEADKIVDACQHFMQPSDCIDFYSCLRLCHKG